ncbi:hypothetical protein MPSEU_000753600 [Mayamaea pseudoterrestris]|nr:hypothetical protein MPSEU_000753600 [Mayamaea pseudoterrestris]
MINSCSSMKIFALLWSVSTTLAFTASPGDCFSKKRVLSSQQSNQQHQDASDTSLAAISSRRLVLQTGIAAIAAATILGISLPSFASTSDLVESLSTSSSTTGTVDYKAVASDIAALIKQDPNKGPTMVRLAWHSCGTYDASDQTGGSSSGSIRFAKELAHGGNAGLALSAVAWLEPVYEKHAGLSHADLYTLAGVVAIHEMKGPVIQWKSGRIDALDDQGVTADGRLPNADSGPPLADPTDAKHVRQVFNRMGFNDQEIVALSGAHALGRCHENNSGYSGPWTPTPTTFNNAYYTLLTNLKWVPKDWSGPPQYVNGPTGQLMMLPTDVVLLQDKSFKKWVDVYAKDAQTFYDDFSKSFQKLEELGTSGLVATEWV